MSVLELNLNDRPMITYSGVGLYKGSSIHHFTLKDVYTMHLYEYDGELSCNSQKFRIQPSCLSITPPYAKLDYYFQDTICNHYCFHFKLSKSNHQKIYSIPIMQSLNKKKDILKKFKQAVNNYVTASLESEVSLWNILFELSTKNNDTQLKKFHPAISESLNYIDANLHKNLSVKDIAKNVNLTPTHLSRIFKHDLKTTIVQYLTKQRVEKAEYMLIYTTKSIKVIAYEVGIPDIQYFNKVIRKFTGLAPSKIRSNKSI